MWVFIVFFIGGGTIKLINEELVNNWWVTNAENLAGQCPQTQDDPSPNGKEHWNVLNCGHFGSVL